MPELSIIIPTLNEEDCLGGLLGDLRLQSGVDLEVILCDGGSIDGTLSATAAWKHRVLRTAPGRGRQMNAGAREATAPMLLFLHADTRISRPDLLRRGLDAFLAEERPGEILAGHFPLRFPSPLCRGCLRYRYLETKSTLGLPHTIHGDQGLMIRPSALRDLGGFSEALPFLEDELLAAQIFRQGRFILLPGRLLTSTRRFDEAGFYPTYLRMAVIMGALASETPEFFDALRSLYAREGAPTTAEVLRTVADVTTALGPAQGLQRWLKAGRFIRENAWQLGLAADMILAPLLGDDLPTTQAIQDHLEGRLARLGLAIDGTTAALTVAALYGFYAAEILGLRDGPQGLQACLR